MKQTSQSELHELVARFWNGESSLREEERLRELLAGDDIPAEYDGLAAYFQEASEELNTENLYSVSDGSGSKPISTKEKLIIVFALTILLALAIWYFCNTYMMKAEMEQLPIDTAMDQSNFLNDTFVLFTQLFIDY